MRDRIFYQQDGGDNNVNTEVSPFGLDVKQKTEGLAPLAEKEKSKGLLDQSSDYAKSYKKWSPFDPKGEDSSYSVLDNIDVKSREEELKKKEQKKQEDIQTKKMINALQNLAQADPQELEKSGIDRKLIAAAQGFKAFTINDQLMSKTEIMRAQNEYMAEIERNVYMNYINSQGKLMNDSELYNKALGTASSRAVKPQVSTGAYDAYRSQGAPQMDMPELQDRDRQIIARTVSGIFASTMKNIMAGIAGGDTQAMAATSVDPGALINAETGQMLATDIAKYEERKQKVADINFELEREYKNNLIQMQAAVEAKQDAAENLYQANIQQQALHYVDKYDADIKQMYQVKIAKAESQSKIEQYERGLQQFNAQQKQIASNKRQEYAIRMGQAHMKANTVAKKHKLPFTFQELSKRMPILQSKMGITASTVYNFYDKLEQLPPGTFGSQGWNAYNLMTQRSKDALDRVKEYDESAAKNIVGNLAFLASMNRVPKNLTPSTLDMLSREMFSSSTVQSDNWEVIDQEFIKDDITSIYFGAGLLYNAGSMAESAYRDAIIKRDPGMIDKIWSK